MKARYNGKEYVITQPIDENMSFNAVHEVLIAKFELLAQCNGIKQKFDEFVKGGDVQGVPGMSFKSAVY